jgi:hemerythrin
VDLLNRVGAFTESVKNGTVDAEALMDFLNDWLVNHIMNSDRKYASYFKINSDQKLRAARAR